MRKAFLKALRDHLRDTGEVTGYMVITFRDGVAMVSSEACQTDEPAQEILEAIALALAEPSGPADEWDDEIGVCQGNA